MSPFLGGGSTPVVLGLNGMTVYNLQFIKGKLNCTPFYQQLNHDRRSNDGRASDSIFSFFAAAAAAKSTRLLLLEVNN
jgi:hypothetical protein